MMIVVHHWLPLRTLVAEVAVAVIEEPLLGLLLIHLRLHLMVHLLRKLWLREVAKHLTRGMLRSLKGKERFTFMS